MNSIQIQVRLNQCNFPSPSIYYYSYLFFSPANDANLRCFVYVYSDILVWKKSFDAEKRNKQEKESTVGEQEQTSVTLEEAVGEVWDRRD